MLVEKSNKTFLTSVYRKPTFTDSMHAWIYFDQRKRKLILLALLFTELLKFALRKKLSSEVNKIKTILRQNSYPEEVTIFKNKKISNFETSKRFDPKKCSVYLKLL